MTAPIMAPTVAGQPCVEAAYYALAPNPITPAMVFAGPDIFVTADPRRLPVSEIARRCPSLRELTNGWSLVRLAPPPGADVVQDEATGFCALTNPGTGPGQTGGFGGPIWSIEEIEPATAVLGPQAEALLAAAEVAARTLTSGTVPPASGSAEESFITASDTLCLQGGAVALRQAEDAAIEALEEAGADAYWLTAVLGGAPAGTALLALAARDLIGATPDWTQAAYDLLTSPWLTALGPLHPGDNVAVGAGGVTPTGSVSLDYPSKAELQAALEAVTGPGDGVAVLAMDAEGNGFAPVASITTGLYEANSTWSGVIVQQPADGAVPAIVLQAGTGTAISRTDLAARLRASDAPEDAVVVVVGDKWPSPLAEISDEMYEPSAGGWEGWPGELADPDDPSEDAIAALVLWPIN